MMIRKIWLIALATALAGALSYASGPDAEEQARAAARAQVAAQKAAQKRAADLAERDRLLAAKKVKDDAQESAKYRKKYGERTAGMTDAQVVQAGRGWEAEREAKKEKEAAEVIKGLSPAERALFEKMSGKSIEAQMQEQSSGSKKTK